MKEAVESDEDPATGESIGRLTTLMPSAMLADLRAEASDVRMMVGEFVRGILRDHLNEEECGECDEDVPEDALYCPYCGAEFETEEDEESEKEE